MPKDPDIDKKDGAPVNVYEIFMFASDGIGVMLGSKKLCAIASSVKVRVLLLGVNEVAQKIVNVISLKSLRYAETPSLR